MSLANLGRKKHIALAAIVSVAFFVFLTLALIATPGFSDEGIGGAEDFDRLALAIFDTHVLALEALGILLTAALIGAMVIARPLGTTPDTKNYPNKRSAARLAEVQFISNIDRNLSDDGNFVPTPMDAPTEDEEE